MKNVTQLYLLCKCHSFGKLKAAYHTNIYTDLTKVDMGMFFRLSICSLVVVWYMLIRQHVNNDVSKDSPIDHFVLWPRNGPTSILRYVTH